MSRRTRSAAIKDVLSKPPGSGTVSTSAKRRKASTAIASKVASPAPSATPARASTKAADAAPAPPTLLFPDAPAWESWLESNFNDALGLWLKFRKKGSSAPPSVTYEEALDAALCYGWIDGQTRSIDGDYFARRFTPRRRASLWSRRNVDKIAELAAADRIRPSGQAEIDAARADGRWDRAYASQSNAKVPADFQRALAKNPKAGKFFDTLNKGQRYSFLMRIETAKRAETREKKIAEYVELLREHKTL